MTNKKKPKKEERYIYSVRSGSWAISRKINGTWVYLIQGRSLCNKNDYLVVLKALNLSHTNKNINRYFPKKSKEGLRCPTFALIRLFGELGYVQDKQKEIGV